MSDGENLKIDQQVFPLNKDDRIILNDILFLMMSSFHFFGMSEDWKKDTKGKKRQIMIPLIFCIWFNYINSNLDKYLISFKRGISPRESLYNYKYITKILKHDDSLDLFRNPLKNYLFLYGAGNVIDDIENITCIEDIETSSILDSIKAGNSNNSKILDKLPAKISQFIRRIKDYFTKKNKYALGNFVFDLYVLISGLDFTIYSFTNNIEKYFPLCDDCKKITKKYVKGYIRPTKDCENSLRDGKQCSDSYRNRISGFKTNFDKLICAFSENMMLVNKNILYNEEIDIIKKALIKKKLRYKFWNNEKNKRRKLEK